MTPADLGTNLGAIAAATAAAIVAWDGRRAARSAQRELGGAAPNEPDVATRLAGMERTLGDVATEQVEMRRSLDTHLQLHAFVGGQGWSARQQ